MTVQDALLILDLSAPITREMLSSAYEEGVEVWNPKNFEGRVSLLAKAAAKTEQLFLAHDLLSRQPDDAFPFQGSVKARTGAAGLTRPGAAPTAVGDVTSPPPPQALQSPQSLPPPHSLPPAQSLPPPQALPPPQSLPPQSLPPQSLPPAPSVAMEQPAMAPPPMGMVMEQPVESAPEARPMPRAMKPRPRQMSEMPPQEMPPVTEMSMHERGRADVVPAPAAAEMDAAAAAGTMSGEVPAEAWASATPPSSLPMQAPISSAAAGASPSARAQALPPLPAPPPPRTPQPAQPEAMFSAPQPEAPVFAPIPGHAPMETREALAPLPLEAVQGNQALKNANAKPLPPLPLNGTPGKTAVEQVAQTPGLPGGRPAPFLYRAGAWLFDVIIFALFATVIGTGNVAENGGPGGGVSLAGVLKLLALLVFSLLYYVLLESSATQGTLGKKACGLVVTDMQGRRISLGRATGRFFARLLCWPLTLGIGYVIAAFTKQRQGLHDMVAGCLVRRGAPESAGLPTGEMKKERTPAILIILGLGVTAAACMVGYTYFISHSEVSLPASEPSVTAAPASAPGATPAPVAAPPAGTNSAAIPNTGTGTGAGMPMPPATGATVWKKGLPMADVQALAARGDVQAQMELAFACAAGRGVPKSLTTAAEWMRKAADTGDGFAQYHMGYAYRMGEGVPKDDAEAARWYRKAAEQGVALAQVDLACAYFAGEGVAKDDAASVMWMRKAAEQNNREALDSLGSAYQYGVGVTKDLEEAVKWYRKAAALNYPLGLFHLGACYEDGQGVTRDLAEALKWYILTDANGDQGIIDARNELEGRMSLEDRAEAVRRAKEEAERLEKK